MRYLPLPDEIVNTAIKDKSANDDSLIAPPGFRPFFTLIQDPTSGEPQHPAVHYIFSDDDPDIVSAAISDAAQNEDSSELRMEQRFILVDVGRDGRTIDSAHSLSPAWQILGSTTSQAPSWNDGGPGKTAEALMMKIEGTSRLGRYKEQPGEGGEEDAVAAMESTVGDYNDRLSLLEGLLDNPTIQSHKASSSG